MYFELNAKLIIIIGEVSGVGIAPSSGKHSISNDTYFNCELEILSISLISEAITTLSHRISLSIDLVKGIHLIDAHRIP